jgi:hypothetical protein
MNVIAQAVGVQGEGEAMRLSLSSNPDVAFEVIEKMRAAGQPLMTIGCDQPQDAVHAEWRGIRAPTSTMWW